MIDTNQAIKWDLKHQYYNKRYVITVMHMSKELLLVQEETMEIEKIGISHLKQCSIY